MKHLNEILRVYLGEQIAMEEHLYLGIQHQMLGLNLTPFADAKALLTKTMQVLEQHFIPLNTLLDQLDQESERTQARVARTNGVSPALLRTASLGTEPLSKVLRDDYSALNGVAMSNTLLHTTALALQREKVAALALSHLKNLTPLVVQLGQLLPHVITRELQAAAPDIPLTVAETALTNAERAWRSAT